MDDLVTDSAAPDSPLPVDAPSSVPPETSVKTEPTEVTDLPDTKTSTLAEHEAAFAPARDEQTGRWVQKRHRAASQQAGPEDVKAIGEFTKRIKEAEAKAGADIKQQAGESNRVFELRRRAELAERGIKVTAAPVAPKPEPTAPRPAAVTATGDDPEPNPENAQRYPDGQFDRQYLKDQARWEARQEFKAERERQTRLDEQTKLRTTFDARVADARTKYPDFDAVAFSPKTPIPPGSLIEAWIFEHKTGPEVLYHLHQHPAEVLQITALSPLDQAESLTLLGQRLTTTNLRPQAGSTGSAATPVASSVTRPPNPVRTGPMRTGDTPPGDDSSLADHERYFGQARRR